MDKNYYSFIVPAGKYWLTDPMYVLSEYDWTAFLAQCIKNAGEVNANYEQIDNTQIVSFVAECSSGQYKDKQGDIYCTDSGLIGLVSYDYSPELDIASCGVLVDFNVETLCCANNGILIFGDRIIDTASDCTQSDGMEL